MTVGAPGADFASIRVPGLRGSFTPEGALRRLLAGTGFGFIRIDSRTFRIVPRHMPRAAPPPARAPAWPQTPPPETGEIIVTASKRNAPLGSFPATVDIVDLGERGIGESGATGTRQLLARMPTLASTNLGRGRDKLFIRGVADSSFTGPTQATVGQYLGEVRVNYNAPDPDLALYDMARVEVIEGPQGTLYGAGSLGGVLRLLPNDPSLTDYAGSVAGGVTQLSDGSAGYDFAAMLNIPVAADRLAVRLVGYGALEGGYIDDIGRGLADVNRTRISGGRASVRIHPGDDWTLDFGAVAQMIDARDSHYADLLAPPLSRSSAVAQPFDNDYRLWHAVIRKSWEQLQLISATGYVRHDLTERYDATGFDGTGVPAVFDEDDKITLLTHETRLAKQDGDGTGWLIGVALVSDVDRTTRPMGPADDPPMILGIRNETTEAALFGEVSMALGDDFIATLGGRITYAHLTGQLLAMQDDEFEPSRNAFRLLPTAALAWRPREGTLLFLRYQEGFRAGGLSVGHAALASEVTRFRSDKIGTIEAGLRVGRRDRDRFSAAASLSYARWTNVQADLILPGNLPTTANIGDGRIYGFEANARWRPTQNLTADFGIFLNDSGLDIVETETGDGDLEELPNIARIGVSGAITWETMVEPGVELGIQAAGRYIGPTQLGVGPLDLAQGDYLDTSVTIRVGSDALALSVSITNIANTMGNSFAVGNPFGESFGHQATPLRPRAIRIGASSAF